MRLCEIAPHVAPHYERLLIERCLSNAFMLCWWEFRRRNILTSHCGLQMNEIILEKMRQKTSNLDDFPNIEKSDWNKKQVDWWNNKSEVVDMIQVKTRFSEYDCQPAGSGQLSSAVLDFQIRYLNSNTHLLNADFFIIFRWSRRFPARRFPPQIATTYCHDVRLNLLRLTSCT